jgi:hypothetical protein
MGEEGMKIRRMYVRLSTIIEADNFVEKQCQLCRRITSHWKQGETIQPVIILDAPTASEWDLKIAGQFLDFFAQPWRGILVKPEFRIVKGTAEDYRAFFEEYRESYEFHKKYSCIKEVSVSESLCHRV